MKYSDETLAKVMEHVGTVLFEAHRGVVRYGDELIVFGNDGFQQDDRVKEEYRLMLDWLSRNGYRERANLLGRDGYSWMILVGPPPGRGAMEPVEHALWSCWAKAFGVTPGDGSLGDAFRDYQQGVARKVLCGVDLGK